MEACTWGAWLVRTSTAPAASESFHHLLRIWRTQSRPNSASSVSRTTAASTAAGFVSHSFRKTRNSSLSRSRPSSEMGKRPGGGSYRGSDAGMTMCQIARRRRKPAKRMADPPLDEPPDACIRSCSRPAASSPSAVLEFQEAAARGSQSLAGHRRRLARRRKRGPSAARDQLTSS